MTRKQIPLRLPAELAQAVDEYAQARKLGRNAAIVAILSNVLTPDLASEPVKVADVPRKLVKAGNVAKPVAPDGWKPFAGLAADGSELPSRKAQPKTTKQKGK